MARFVRRPVACAGCALLVGIQVAPPAAAGPPDAPPPFAMAQDACTATLQVEQLVIDALTIDDRGLQIYLTGLSLLSKAISTAIEAEKAIEITDDAIVDIRRLFEETAPLAEPMPNFQSGLQNAATVLKTAHETFLKDVRTAIVDFVNEADLKDEGPAVKQMWDDAYPVQQKIDSVLSVVKKLKTATSLACRVIQGSPAAWIQPEETRVSGPSGSPAFAPAQSTCRAELQTIVGQVDTVVSGVQSRLQPATQGLESAENLMDSVLTPMMKPVDAVAAAVADVHKAAMAMHDAYARFQHALKTMIKVEVAGITLAAFSVDEILRDWNRIVKRLEDDLHITEAKKWLQHQVNAVLGPIIGDMLAPVHAFERSFSAELHAVDGAFTRLANSMAAVKAFDAAELQLQNFTTQLQTKAQACK